MADAADAADPSLRYAKDGSIAWITADNPARMNALTAAMWKAIPDAIATAAGDPDVRVVVLRGGGRQGILGGARIFRSSKAPGPAMPPRPTTR